MTHKKTKIGFVGALAFSSVLTFSAGDGLLSFASADAVIGRPLTPMSYAGVARRTTRRAVAVGAATGGYYGGYGYGAYPYRYGYGYGTGYGYSAPYYSSLPSGCVRTTASGALVYDCNGTSYRPIYDGPDVVYVVDDDDDDDDDDD